MPEIPHSEATQQSDNSDMEVTQQETIDAAHIIPEISQRITRKRKRE